MRVRGGKSIMVLCGVLMLSGCGEDDPRPAAPGADVVSTAAAVAAERRRLLDRAMPRGGELIAKRNRYRTVAQEALGTQQIEVTVSEPGTVLVATPFAAPGIEPGPRSRARARRLERACAAIQEETPKASVIFAARGGQEMFRCTAAGN